MASHGSYNKGMGPQLLKLLYHTLYNEGEVADSPAAYAQSDLHAGFYPGADLLLGKFRPDSALHICQTVLLKILPDPVHLGKRALGIFF